VSVSRPLSRGWRLVVHVLAALLPADLRERQRGEWTADLLDVGDGPAGRYLAGAALTLPSLWLAARRGRLATGFEATAGTGPVTGALARLLLVGLGWPIGSWVLAVPVNYLLRHGAGDWKPGGLLLLALFPLLVTLVFGAYAALLGGPFLAGALGIGAVVAGLTRRRSPVPQRLALALPGLAVTGAASLLIFTGAVAPVAELDRGYSAAVLGLFTLGFGLHSRRLRSPTRIALMLIGLGALGVFIAHHTMLGHTLQTWFMD
jgi:hypothetical protein